MTNSQEPRQIPINWRLNDFRFSTGFLRLKLLELGLSPQDVDVDRVGKILGLLNSIPGLLQPMPPATLEVCLKSHLETGDLQIAARAVVAFSAIVQILQDFVPTAKSYKKRNQLKKDFYELLPVLLYLSIHDQMEKMLKKALNGLLALGTGKSTDAYHILLFSGSFRRLLKTKTVYMSKSSSSHSAAKFLLSLFHSKRCWLELSANLKVKAMQDHKENFTRLTSLDQEAEKYIKYAVDLVFPPGTHYSPGLCVPTFYASHESTSAEGGNHSYILNKFDIPLNTVKLYDINRPLDLGGICFSAKENHLYNRCEDEFSLTDNQLDFMALPEAGKFRIITKGPSVLYTGFRPFQKFLLSGWQKTRFATMLETSKVDEMMFSLGDRLCNVNSKLQGRDRWMFFSGDYDAATDKMKQGATLACLARIIDNLGLADTNLAYHLLRSFSIMEINYPEMGPFPPETLKCINGQPMGHPVSFPLLCLINLSTFLRTIGYECEGTQINFIGPLPKGQYRFRVGATAVIIRSPKNIRQLSNVIINGDDILFIGPVEYGMRWQESAADVGLVVNENKTYESERYSLLNSRFIDHQKKKLIHYAPYALAYGHNVKRETGGEGWSYLSTIWKQIEEGPIESRKTLRRVVLSTFKRWCNESQIEPRLFPNLFLPKLLGGLGFTVPDGFRYSFSRFQRQLATFLIRNPKESYLLEQDELCRESVKGAQKLARKLLPEATFFLEGGRPLYGPLNEDEDFSLVFDKVLGKALQAYSFVTGSYPNLTNKTRYKYSVIGRVLRHKEPPYSHKKLREFQPALLRVSGERA